MLRPIMKAKRVPIPGFLLKQWLRDSAVKAHAVCDVITSPRHSVADRIYASFLQG
jgi:hypothetical protein